MTTPKQLLTGIILGTALLVRLIHLNGSFWLDEAAQAIQSARALSQQLSIANDFQPPLYHLLVHVLIQFNQAEWWLRLASLIPGLITVWLTIKLGTRLFSDDVGNTAGMLLATSQFHLFYSQELRPYSLAAMFSLLTIWYWLDLVGKTPKSQFKFVLAALAGLYTMYLFPALLVSLLIITYFLHRPKFLLLASCFLVLLVGFLPWTPSLLEQLRLGTSLATDQPLWASIVSPPLLKMLPLLVVKFIFGRIPYDPNPATLGFSAVVGIAILALLSRTRTKPNGPLLFGLIGLPVLVAFLISVFVPVLDPKRVLFVLPLTYVALAAGLGKRLNSLVILSLLLLINLTAIRRYATNQDLQREPWSEAVATLEQQAPKGTQIIFAFDAPFAPWVWYQTQNLPTISVTNPDLLPPLDTQYLVLFDYLRPLFDPNNQLPNSITVQGYAESGFYQYPGIGKMTVYAR